jgi:hypothetical protein
VLENFTPVSPIKRSREASRNYSFAFARQNEGQSMGNFEFPNQSMEDLLNTEGLVSHNVPQQPHFPDGFIGFEEFSGWDGFNINQM